MPASNDLKDKETLRLVEKLISDQIYSLVITGGEPLIRTATTLRAVKMAKEAGMFVSLNTNLLLLTEEILSKLKDSGINSLLVSCPASEPNIYRQITRCGDYNRFRSRLKMLIDSDISCLINMVVTQTNFQFIRSTAIDLVKLGIKRFAATPVSLNVEYPDYKSLLTKSQIRVLLEDLDWCADNLGLGIDILEPLPKCFFPDWCWEKGSPLTKRSCQAGRMSVSMSNIGDIRPCSHNPIIYGNIFQQSLESIWDKMSIYRNGAIPNICKHCPSSPFCNGGCRTNALAATGRLDEPDYLTVGPRKFSSQKQEEIIIKGDYFLYFKGKIRWRREEGNSYSISAKKNHLDLIIVNEETFRLVCWLEKNAPLTVKELRQKSYNTSTEAAFFEVLKSLIRKGFICIKYDGPVCQTILRPLKS